jgi:hypothetical protein
MNLTINDHDLEPNKQENHGSSDEQSKNRNENRR